MEKIILKGIPVYTSDELKEKLKSLIQKIGMPTSKALLIKLVDDGVLVPVINESAKIKQLLMKIKKQHPLINLGGTTQDGVGYVIFGPKSTNKRAVRSALHEMIHVSHQQFPNKFHFLNMPLYVKFYSYYYKQLFEAKSYDQELFTKFIKKLIKDSESTYIYWDLYLKLLKSAFVKHTSLSKQQFQDRVILIAKSIENILNSQYGIDNYNLAAVLLRKTYRYLFKGMASDTGVGQELWVPGEIIAVLSTINPDHPNVIKSLELIKPGKKPVIDVKARIKIIKD